MIKHKVKFYVSSIFFVLLMSQNISAETYEANYAKWKAQQQQQDQRLQQKTSQSDQYYLSKPNTVANGNQVALNTATVEQLMQLSGVGQKKAQAIIEYRQKAGQFKSIDELQNVKGIGPALFEKNKAKLRL